MNRTRDENYDILAVLSRPLLLERIIVRRGYYSNGRRSPAGPPGLPPVPGASPGPIIAGVMERDKGRNG